MALKLTINKDEGWSWARSAVSAGRLESAAARADDHMGQGFALEFNLDDARAIQQARAILQRP